MTPGSTESSTCVSSRNRLITSSTSSAGADAPAVMPTAVALFDPARVERASVFDQIAGHPAFGRDLAQPIRIRAVRRADNEDNIDNLCEFPRRSLAILRCVADVLGVGADDRREAGLQRFDDGARIVDAEGGLGDKGELVRVGDLEPHDLFRRRDQMHAAVNSPHRADDFRVSGMSDQDDLATLVGVALALDVHFRDQRASRVDDRKPAVGRAFLDRAGDPMRAENRDGALRDFVDLVDEMCALGAQALDNVAIVHDFVADIDRRTDIFRARARRSRWRVRPPRRSLVAGLALPA